MGDENDKNKDKTLESKVAEPGPVFRQREESFGGGSAEEIDVDEVSLSKLRAAAAAAAAARKRPTKEDGAQIAQNASDNNNKKKPPLSPPRPLPSVGGRGGASPPPLAATGAPAVADLSAPSSGPLGLDHVMLPVLNDPSPGGGGGAEGLGLTESSKTPKATNHRRIASNGLDTVSVLSQASNQLHPPRRISMRDVMRHSPMENEAEAHLQRAVEEYEDNHKDATVDRARMSIFSQVPTNVSTRTFRQEPTPPISPIRPALSGAASGASTNTLPLHRRGPPSASSVPTRKQKQKHRKVNSTADTLFQLTKDLDEINAAAAADGSAVDETLDGLRLIDSDEADGDERRSLIRNADVLLRDDLAQFRALRRGDAKMGHRATLRTKLSQPERIQEENEESTGHHDDNDDGGEAGEPTGASSHAVLKFKSNAVGKAKGEFRDFEDWLKHRRLNVWAQAKVILFFIMLPCTGIAAILFYLAGNPPCGYKTCTSEQQGTIGLFVNASYQASASWWLLFLGCRQVITLSMARVMDAFVIDYVALQSKYMTMILGPYITLFVVQAKGWPFIVFFWCIFDFVMLFGSNHFANHWLFYQEAIRMFSILNPSGNVPDSPWYRTLLIVGAVAPVIVAIKRYYMGIVQGRRLYNRYADELSRVMERTLLINKVGKLAREIETMGLRFENFNFKAATYQRTDSAPSDNEEADGEEEDERSLLQQGFYNISTRAKLNELLGEWEEPESICEKEDQPNIGDIIQFRHSLQYLSSRVPFGLCFGLSSTRQECVESSEIVYNRLLQSIPGRDVLSFDVMAMLAMRDKSGELDEDMLSNLITLFRPDRDGVLTLLDFAKSVDTVYKELRMLRANVANASKLDRAFESIFNCFFYIIVAMFFLGVLGFDPFALLAAVSAIIVGFAFMINIACSSWVNGLLLILVRRPYDVGDRIHISNPQDDTDGMGSPGWFVKDIDLFTTTVVLGVTNEVATYSNGSLANFRIINGTRSHKAILGFFLKFPLDVHFGKLRLFHDAIERFVRARPREWGALLAFRCTRVEADLGYVEYVVRAQHRESWHSIAPFASKADLTNFALELSKKMNIRYVSPPKPIDLTLKNGFPGFRPDDNGHPAGHNGDGGDEDDGDDDDNNGRRRRNRRGDARSLDGSLDESEMGHAAEDVAQMLFDIPLPPPRIEV